MRKTKVICTLGPSSNTEAVITQLVKAGMNVARFNFSHGTHESQLATYMILNKVKNDLGANVATLLDTKGPEIRLRKFKDGKAVLKEGSLFDLHVDEVLGDENRATISYANLPSDLGNCKQILLDDGLIDLEVLSVEEKVIHCRVVAGGDISDNKGVNVPGSHFTMPYLSDRDKEDIEFGIRTGFDIIACSFMRTKEDAQLVRDFLDSRGGSHLRILAKIENAEGVDHINEITDVVDSVMIARGDMGVEIAFEEIPVIQKKIIKLCARKGKQVVTATQMLESMIHHPRPTRAEITDVANAIYDGTSCLMLSGETANGKYPVEAVKAMVRIAERTEGDIDYKKRFFQDNIAEDSHDVTDAISHATCMIAYNLKAKAIITVTKSGSTAYMISRFRPDIPIIACTPDSTALRQMCVSWGVVPLMVGKERVTEVLFDQAVNTAKHAGLVEAGDLVVLTAGVPLARAGNTNLIKVSTVPN